MRTAKNNDMCDTKDLLVGYLYGELDGAERTAFDAHLVSCADCRNELAGLRSARGQLAAWAPPAPDLGLRMVRGASALPPARVRAVPAWGLAAAAALVLAASAALANVEIRYDGDGVIVRTGWARSAAQADARPERGVQPPQPVAAPAAAPDTRGEFEAIRARLTELEAELQRTPAATSASASGRSDAEILRRVRQAISEAEARQERAMAVQMAQLFRDFDRQRRADLAVFQQGLGQYQGLTNTELATTRDMVNQLGVQISTRQEK